MLTQFLHRSISNPNLKDTPFSLKSHVFMTVRWNLTARIDQILLKMTEAERHHTKRNKGTREFEQRPWIVNLRTSVSDPILHS